MSLYKYTIDYSALPESEVGPLLDRLDSYGIIRGSNNPKKHYYEIMIEKNIDISTLQIPDCCYVSREG